MCVFEDPLVDKDDTRPLSGGGNLEQGPEGGPGPDGDDTPLLDRVYVDGFANVGLRPQGWQVLQKLPGGDRRIGVEHDQ